MSRQILVQQTAAPGQSVTAAQSPDTVLQLQQALRQIGDIGTALSDIQRFYQDQVCVHVKEGGCKCQRERDRD